ncbi:hypothetical protein PTSG_06087 [Salpingoeca rosetta]|uniref:Uncharacterized protein n=1 Tax=Salpingoeca rosetta (strain ATCC 50818 / BSB-021) TaxID=946362 RepID=F2UDM9_SALR5|nr:uncharacterized protein PTSG_06087 [Salpingoeca rosetta]EGD74724.1 hypothetical protein PTSG_06087 [Salpingoeca rosetta]|eukprot:XP_004992981.1 hypothetical protein PTSG_06087 [Salpingoeca rosetta]
MMMTLSSSMPVLLAATLTALLGGVVGVPCPENAIFVHDGMCACRPELQCLGGKCSSPPRTMQIKFSEALLTNAKAGAISSEAREAVAVHAFPADCLDCLCAPLTATKGDHERLLKELEPSFAVVSYRGSHAPVRDFHDPAFTAMCWPYFKSSPSAADNSNSAGRPSILDELAPTSVSAVRWLHVPMAGDFMQAVLRQQACRPPQHTQPSGNTRHPVHSCSSCFQSCVNSECNDGDEDAKCPTQFLGAVDGAEDFTGLTNATHAATVAVFRHPRQRLLAAYNEDRLVPGMSDAEHARMAQVTQTLESFANFPGVAGCQTRMAVGMPCGVHVQRLERWLPRAKANVVTNLPFVGIHEHPNATACLFHRMFGVRMHMAELEAFTDNQYSRSSSSSSDTGDADTTHEASSARTKDAQPNKGAKELHPAPPYTQVAFDAPAEKQVLPASEWRVLNEHHDQEDERLYHAAVGAFNQLLSDHGFKPVASAIIDK